MIHKIFNYIALHGSWVVGGKVVSMISMLLLSVGLTKLLSMEQFGQYQLALSILTMSMIFSFNDFNSVVVKYLSLGYDSIYEKLVKFRLKYSFLGSIFLLIIAIYYFIENNTEMFYVSLLLSLFFPMFYTFNLYKALLQAKERFKILSIYNMLLSIFLLIILLPIAYIFDDFMVVFLAYIFVNIFLNFYFYKNTLKLLKNTKENMDIQYDALKLGITLSVINVLVYVLESVDKFLIGNFISLKALAIFTIGVTLSKSILMLFKEILNIFNNKLTKHKINIYIVLLVFGLGSVIGYILSLIIPYVITFLYSDNYKDSVVYAQILLYSLGLYLSSTLIQNYFLFHGKKNEKVIFIFNVISPLTQILLLFIIIFYLNINDYDKLLYITYMFAIRPLYAINLLFTIKYILTKRTKNDTQKI